MSKRSKIEAYYFRHFNNRLGTRYGLQATLEQYRFLCLDICLRKVRELVPLPSGDQEGLVKFKGSWIRFYFNKKWGLISTALPPKESQ